MLRRIASARRRIAPRCRPSGPLRSLARTSDGIGPTSERCPSRSTRPLGGTASAASPALARGNTPPLVVVRLPPPSRVADATTDAARFNSTAVPLRVPLRGTSDRDAAAEPPSAAAAAAAATVPVEAEPSKEAAGRGGGGASSFAPTAVPDFDDPSSAHGSKTGTELMRAVLVYQLCRVPAVVENAEALLDLSRGMFGARLTERVMRSTFFHHFCAGEDERSIDPAIDALRRHGIGGILDYAAEGDGRCENDVGPSGDDGGDGIVSAPPYDQPARVYDYRSEVQCDRHVETFLRCVRAVRDVSPDGFAAVKVTALGNPQLLERMSTAITEAKNLYQKFDLDRDGVITRDEFTKCYRLFFNDADNKVHKLLNILDPNKSDTVDYIEWSRMLAPPHLPEITANCREVGPLALATPSREEIDLYGAMRERMRTVAEEASACGVRLLIDAEHAKFRPAIDNLVLDLQHTYNATDRTDTPVVFNTHQCYLRDAPERIRTDLERSRRYSYHFATKLVRGAYMIHERERAREMGYPDPVHDTIDDTHACYDEAVEYLLRHRAENDSTLEIMCATHNQASVEKAIGLMNELGIGPSDSAVHFAQLYGMSDNLTYTLGRNGFHAYKYVPYGLVNEVMPYLMRRAQENSGMMGGSSKELDLLYGELKRRAFGI